MEWLSRSRRWLKAGERVAQAFKATLKTVFTSICKYSVSAPPPHAQNCIWSQSNSKIAHHGGLELCHSTRTHQFRFRSPISPRWFQPYKQRKTKEIVQERFSQILMNEKQTIFPHSFLIIFSGSLAYIFLGLQSIRAGVMNWKGAQVLESHRPRCKSASVTNVLCDFGQITSPLCAFVACSSPKMG